MMYTISDLSSLLCVLNCNGQLDQQTKIWVNALIILAYDSSSAMKPAQQSILRILLYVL